MPEAQRSRVDESGPDQAAAERLAAELRESPSQVWTRRKVTTLLSQFGAYRLTDEVKERMSAALRAAGLRFDPDISTLRRSDDIQLSLEQPSDDGRHHAASSPDRWVESLVDATVWERGRPPERVSLEGARRSHQTIWLDVDVHATRQSRKVFEVLVELCPGLSYEMIDDLFRPDSMPETKAYGDGSIHKVSITQVVATDRAPVELGAEPPGSDVSKAGFLVCQLVECLASDRWVITVWHEREVYEGGNPRPLMAGVASGEHEACFERVGERWQRRPFDGAGDLGLLFLLEIVSGYVLARRELYSALDLWQDRFYKATLKEQEETVERQTLAALRGLATQFRQRVNAFEQAGAKVDWDWFCGITARREQESLRDLLNSSLRDLRDLADALRGSFDLIASTSASRQLKLAEENRKLGEGFQHVLGLLGAVVLAPTLVATVFSANEQLLDVAGDKWIGWGLMLAVMAAVGLLTLGLVRRLTGQGRRSRAAKRRERDV